MQNEAKKIRWGLWGCGGVLVLIVGGSAFAISGVKSSLHHLKERQTAELIPLAEKFTDCFYRDDAECLRASTTWDETTRRNAAALADQTKERLGARGQSVPVGKSWRASTTKRASGTTSFVGFALNVAYERDPNATELFELVDDGHGFRVKSFRVNSPIVVVDAKHAQK